MKRTLLAFAALLPLAVIEAVVHSLAAADFDRDGRIDIAFAEMHQGADPDEVGIFLNRSSGRPWEKVVVSTTGSHGLQILDANGDGAPDLFGANWSGPRQTVELWRHQPAPAAEPHSPTATGSPESLAALTRKVRPDFQLGSFASGLDFTRPENPPLADFFRRNFNIMTVGIYMTGTQRERGAYNFEKTDALIQFAEQNHLQVYLHPMIGGAEYTPKWVNEGGFSAEALQQLMRDRITTILTRYQGRIHHVDVVNESLSGQGRKADGQFEWQEKASRGGDHVWFKTLGMYQGKKHQFPRYLVEAFRIARNVGGPDLKLILNEWGNETTKSPRGHAFLALIQALKEEGIPVDGAGLQLHCRLKDGRLHGWANNQPFDFDAFDAMLKLYEQAGIEVHITEFDIHLGANPTPQDFELQGKYYAEMLRHALQSPAVKSFKTWGFTDRHSWKADGVDGHPLLLDENLQPKPAYLRQVEMLRALAPKVTKPAAQAASARQTATTPPRPWTLGERDGRQCLITPDGKPFLMLGLKHVGGAFAGVPRTEHAALKDKIERELRGWGFNTVPSSEFWDRFPFIVPLDRLVGAGEKRFEDVFDPEFKARLRKKIGDACAKTKNNPNCIGYFKCQYVDQVLPTGMLKQGLHKQDGTTYEECTALLKALHQRLMEQLQDEGRLAQ